MLAPALAALQITETKRLASAFRSFMLNCWRSHRCATCQHIGILMIHRLSCSTAAALRCKSDVIAFRLEQCTSALRASSCSSVNAAARSRRQATRKCAQAYLGMAPILPATAYQLLDRRCYQHRLSAAASWTVRGDSLMPNYMGRGVVLPITEGERFRRLAGQTARPVLKPVPL